MALPQNLLSRRKAEERLQAADSALYELSKVSNVTGFEIRTDRMIKSLLIGQQVQARTAAVKARLDERRAKLAALLEAEKRQQEAEIEASFETPEQIKARILAYARTIKTRQEAERKALVEELEERRFRQSSDVLRGRASKIMTERVALDRVSQMQERADRLRQEAEEQARESAALDGEARRVAAAKAAEVEARRRLEAEMKFVLDQQVQVKKDLTSRDAAWEGQEVAKLLAADRAAGEAQAQAERDRRAAAKAEYERTAAYNAHEKAIKDAAARAEAEADRADIMATLEREQREMEAERAAAIARRKEALAFKAKLEGQMAIQAEDRGWLDDFYRRESEKEWEKRQAKWDAEAAARKALMADVAASRLAQMQDKAAREAAEREADARALENTRRAQDEDARREFERTGRRLAANAMAGTLNRRQMDENARARELAAQQEYLDWKMQQKFEREYEAKVQATLRGMR